MFVYADHSATSPLRPAAREAMMPFLTEEYGNASSLYQLARRAKIALENARQSIARCLDCDASEVLFTSGGTEADNWALKSVMCERKPDGGHLIVSAVEHAAIMETAAYLRKKGRQVTFLPVDENGVVSPAALKDALQPDTKLVSIMMANNEVGTLQDIQALAAVARQAGVLFHTDAVQAAGHCPLSFRDLGVDMLSLSAHKFGGPKGIGALLVRKGLSLVPLLHGGGHEKGRRSGTENVAGAVGMAAALEESVASLAQSTQTLLSLTKQLDEGILAIPYAFKTGHPTQRLPGHCSYVFEAVEGESLVLNLDAHGICVSSGSACSSSTLEPSHVLLAVGIPQEVAHGSLRLSLGEQNTREQVAYVVEKLTQVIAGKRAMSPLWDEAEQKPLIRFWDRED